jgi:hypothetical protein
MAIVCPTPTIDSRRDENNRPGRDEEFSPRERTSWRGSGDDNGPALGSRPQGDVDSLFYTHGIQPTPRKAPAPIAADDLSTALERLYGPPSPKMLCPAGLPWECNEDGEVVSVYRTCRRNACLPCVRSKIRTLTRKIRSNPPTHLLTLTHAPTSWTATDAAMTELRRILKRGHKPKGIPGYNWDFIWHVERDPSPESAYGHIHGWARGDVPPRDALASAALRVGMGHVVDRRAVSYLGGLGYPWKGTAWNEAALADHRYLNGSRLAHGSNGYWPKSTTVAS